MVRDAFSPEKQTVGPSSTPDPTAFNVADVTQQTHNLERENRMFGKRRSGRANLRHLESATRRRPDCIYTWECFGFR